MDDQPIPSKPDRAALFATASEQHGFFTAPQAARAGFSRRMLVHYARSGEFIRERRGVYRFRDYPSSPRRISSPLVWPQARRMLSSPMRAPWNSSTSPTWCRAPCMSRCLEIAVADGLHWGLPSTRPDIRRHLPRWSSAMASA